MDEGKLAAMNHTKSTSKLTQTHPSQISIFEKRRSSTHHQHTLGFTISLELESSASPLQLPYTDKTLELETQTMKIKLTNLDPDQAIQKSLALVFVEANGRVWECNVVFSSPLCCYSLTSRNV
ncbi:hypothetical protein L6452_02548 [Arctium lappa]|uniref:Uncharacterized protein n=1 Tax=Arctium lappa TaxID=4217 RepID=A0ACB9FKQ2_ARCLA|nr:hypothetical protein L6452_02548 [Arctium lappa]